MTPFDPRSTVAVILAITILIFVVVGSIHGVINPDSVTDVGRRGWARLMDVLVGGLLGYMSGGKSKEDKK